MTFATELAAAAGTLTAAQIAAATGASKRTVEGWRHGKEPIAAYRAYILTRVRKARPMAEAINRGAEMAEANITSKNKRAYEMLAKFGDRYARCWLHANKGPNLFLRAQKHHDALLAD